MNLSLLLGFTILLLNYPDAKVRSILVAFTESKYTVPGPRIELKIPDSQVNALIYLSIVPSVFLCEKVTIAKV